MVSISMELKAIGSPPNLISKIRANVRSFKKIHFLVRKKNENLNLLRGSLNILSLKALKEKLQSNL